MKTQIPDFLLEMSEQMNEQDNRMTAHPLFQVRYDEYITCADGRGDKEVVLAVYHGDYVECDNVSEFIVEISDFRQMNSDVVGEWFDDNSIYDLDDLKHYGDLVCDRFGFEEVEVLNLQKVHKVVKSCLTEKDANDFIKRKQHDYPKLYTYVESMVFCPQMIELRNWIMGLNGEGNR